MAKTGRAPIQEGQGGVNTGGTNRATQREAAQGIERVAHSNQ
jgi:hypothetical protein